MGFVLCSRRCQGWVRVRRRTGAGWGSRRGAAAASKRAPAQRSRLGGVGGTLLALAGARLARALGPALAGADSRRAVGAAARRHAGLGAAGAAVARALTWLCGERGGGGVRCWGRGRERGRWRVGGGRGGRREGEGGTLPGWRPAAARRRVARAWARGRRDSSARRMLACAAPRWRPGGGPHWCRRSSQRCTSTPRRRTCTASAGWGGWGVRGAACAGHRAASGDGRRADGAAIWARRPPRRAAPAARPPRWRSGPRRSRGPFRGAAAP
jgi:hypothetical protein